MTYIYIYIYVLEMRNEEGRDEPACGMLGAKTNAHRGLLKRG